MKYIRLLRVKHYVKNVLIFLPLIFGGKMLNRMSLCRALLGFVTFCTISSIVYIVNDICDKEKDRNHPTKCKRPIASGQVSVGMAWSFVIILFVMAIAFNFQIGQSGLSWLLLLGYLLVNICYSLGMKNIPILDIVLLASGFLLRVLYGSIITNIPISNWLYLTVVSMAFFFGLGKRRNELKNVEDASTRKVLKYYNINYLDKNMYCCLALGIVFYSLWSMEAVCDEMIWTVPLVIIVCMRYSYIIEGESDGDPMEVLLKDKVLIGLVAAFGITMLLLIYVVK